MGNKDQESNAALAAFAQSAVPEFSQSEDAATAILSGAENTVKDRKARLAQGAALNANSVEARKAELRSRRQKRQSLNGMDPKLNLKFTFGDSFYVYIFRDEGNRVQQALSAGYEFIMLDEVAQGLGGYAGADSDGSNRVRVVLGNKDNGDPLYGYPMKQPWEFRNEDLEERELRNIEIDNLIRHGRLAMTQDEQRYVPRDTPINYDPGRSLGNTSR